MADGKSHRQDDNSKKVFDVAKPGKTAASPSSRPLIVGHRPMLKDPMVKDDMLSDMSEPSATKDETVVEEDRPSGGPPQPDNDETDSSEDADFSPTESKIKIEPIDSDRSEEDDNQETDEEIVKVSKATDESDNEEETVEKKPEATDEPADYKPADNVEAKKTDDKDSDETAEGSLADTEAQKIVAKETQEANVKNEHIEKLVVDKTYYVPIGAKARQKRSLRRILIGAVLILALGLLLTDLMIDAGIIKTSLKPPIKVFSGN